jgi:calcineurin-like phosphoesterase
MTGPHDGVLGRRTDCVFEATVNFRPLPFDVAQRDVRLHATLVDVAETTGQATAIERVVVRGGAIHEENETDDEDQERG